MFTVGFLMGLGAAIPFGPINWEITRRNLQFGTLSGVTLGLGACLTDVTYLVVFGLGAGALLKMAWLMRIIGVMGSCILLYFGVMTFRAKRAKLTKVLHKRPLWRDLAAGYLMTFVNPFTILFWSSVVSQLSLIAGEKTSNLAVIGSGVLVGVLGWVLFLNLLLHFLRHKIPDKLTLRLSEIGGVILIGFALFGLFKALF